MYKHEWKNNMIVDGKTYYSKNGILELPKIYKNLNPIEESAESTLDEKEELIKKAVYLGLGAESTLKRNSVETLRKKIEEA